MSRVLFLDNDAILKLVACHLFWETVAALGSTPEELHVLSDAKYVFKKSRRVISKYPEAIRINAISIVEGCQAIKPDFNSELPELEIEGIDPGERLLISATRNESAFYLVTGDKRCLKALAAASQLAEIRERLQGRVICLEQVIFKLIEIQGFDKVLNKVLLGRDYDKALASVFGSGERATEENVLLGLLAYIEDLRQETEGILAVI